MKNYFKHNGLVMLYVILLSVIWSCVGESHSKKLSNQNVSSKIEKEISEETISSKFEKVTEHLIAVFDTVKQTNKLPRSLFRGYRDASDWTSGFYPGNLWMAYEYTKNMGLLEKAQYVTALIEEEKFSTIDHDIGFKIYSSYGRGYELMQSKKYKGVIIQAAKSAIKRYSPKVGAIKSWDFGTERGWQYPVIIDNMMNLELLLVATELTGDSSYYNVAINHANKTMNNQYRADYSCSHVIDYDSITGDFRKRDWNNGNSDTEKAVWSRGQSWGLYGFTMMYKRTGKIEYLRQAENVADFLLGHPNMPEDMVPLWDYSAPEVSKLRDSSAAAILASGLMDLSQLSIRNGDRYFKSGEKILKSLCSSEYFADPGSNGGFILKHATGNVLRKSEVDGTLIYADYYFLEGLMRYSKIDRNS